VVDAVLPLGCELWCVDSIEVLQREVRNVGSFGGVQLVLCGASGLKGGTEIRVVLRSVGLHFGFGGQDGGLIEIVGQRVGREGIGKEKNGEVEARSLGGEAGVGQIALPLLEL